MTNVNLSCPCGARAKRALINACGVRGVHETPCEPATCPTCRTPMTRDDRGAIATSAELAISRALER